MRRIGSGLTPGVADGATAVLRALALGGWATSRSLGWKVGQCPGNIGSVDSVAARLSLRRSQIGRASFRMESGAVPRQYRKCRQCRGPPEFATISVEHRIRMQVDDAPQEQLYAALAGEILPRLRGRAINGAMAR